MNELTTQVWSTVKDQAQVALKSGFLPDTIKTPAQAITIAMKGQELGIPPMAAFSHINIIKGKPTVSAEMMLAMVYQKLPGARVNFTQTNSEACIISASRPGGDTTEFAFSLDDARTAGITGNPSWKKYPSAMLRARCISAMVRAMFPDAALGCTYTPEEMGAEVNEEGEMVREVTPVEEKKAPAPEALPKAEAKPTKAIPGNVEPPHSDSIRKAPVTEKQLRQIKVIAEGKNVPIEEVSKFLKSEFDIDTSRNLKNFQVAIVTKFLNDYRPKES